MLTVCYLAFSPRAPSLEFDHADKWQHMAAFFFLSAFAALSLAPGWRGTLASGLGMFAFGMFIEAVQMHLPARSAEWLDLAADSAGIVLGVLVVVLARRMWPESANRSGPPPAQEFG